MVAPPRSGAGTRTPGERRQSDRARTGARAEAVVAIRLESAGWTILGRNVRVGRSEIDIVAVDPGPPRALVAVEVRANRVSLFGTPEESVGRAKLRSVYRGALGLRIQGRLPDGSPVPRLPLRIDLVAVEASPILAGAAGGWTFRHLRGVTA